MRYRARYGTAVAAKLAYCTAVLAGIFTIAILSVTVVRAIDSVIQVTIVNNGSTVPTLTLDGDGTSVTTTSMPFYLSGGATDLDRIEVYVDNTLSVTIPLVSGASYFSYGLIVPTGSHSIALVGKSSYASITPVANIFVTHIPATTTTDTNESTTDTSPDTQNPQEEDVSTLTNDTSAGSTTYVPALHTAALPKWLYDGLLALDIASPNDPEGKELTAMVQRIVIVTPGIAMLFLARPVLHIYRFVRYKWLGLRGRPFPKFLRLHSLLHIRLVGVLLLGSVLVFS